MLDLVVPAGFAHPDVYLGWVLSPAVRGAVVDVADMSSTRLSAVSRFECVSRWRDH